MKKSGVKIELFDNLTKMFRKSAPGRRRQDAAGQDVSESRYSTMKDTKGHEDLRDPLCPSW